MQTKIPSMSVANRIVCILYIYRQFRIKQYHRILTPFHFMLLSDHFFTRKPDFYLTVSQQNYNGNTVHISLFDIQVV